MKHFEDIKKQEIKSAEKWNKCEEWAKFIEHDTVDSINPCDDIAGWQCLEAGEYGTETEPKWRSLNCEELNQLRSSGK